MQPIRSMFNEVQYELVKLILLNVFLTSTIMFLVAYLVAFFFQMPVWYALILAFVYFVIILFYEIRQITITSVEKNNPELREILRTAKDNMGEDTLMAHALFFEVLDKMKRVSSGTFLDFKKLMMKLGTILVLSIVLVSLSFFGTNIARFDNPLEKPISAFNRFLGAVTGQEPDASGVDLAQDDIFGEARMANLGQDELTAAINPSLDNPDFNNIDPAAPSGDPLADLGGDDVGFNAGGPGTSGDGLNERDLQRSYNYAKQTQGRSS